MCGDDRWWSVVGLHGGAPSVVGPASRVGSCGGADCDGSATVSLGVGVGVGDRRGADRTAVGDTCRALGLGVRAAGAVFGRRRDGEVVVARHRCEEGVVTPDDDEGDHPDRLEPTAESEPRLSSTGLAASTPLRDPLGPNSRPAPYLRGGEGGGEGALAGRLSAAPPLRPSHTPWPDGSAASATLPAAPSPPTPPSPPAPSAAPSAWLLLLPPPLTRPTLPRNRTFGPARGPSHLRVSNPFCCCDAPPPAPVLRLAGEDAGRARVSSVRLGEARPSARCQWGAGGRSACGCW